MPAAVCSDRSDAPAWEHPVEDLAGAVAAYRAEWQHSDAASERCYPSEASTAALNGTDVTGLPASITTGGTSIDTGVAMTARPPPPDPAR